MKKPHIAALTFALGLPALASTSVIAADADAWYDTQRDARYGRPADATPLQQPVTVERTVTYDDRAPVVVEERSAYYAAREPVETIVVSPPYDRAMYDPRHPHWGHLHGRGLFNQAGPNDFGR